MSYPVSELAIGIVFVLFSFVFIIHRLSGKRYYFDSYLNYTWLFFLSFGLSTFVSFTAGIWVLAIICFRALREYFSLIDLRLQDRIGILGAYISIPFMIYFIQIDWYGMFIISIPVYAFLAIPLLITLGGNKAKGTVLSIGTIDYGLFLFVFCLGHIGYLMLFEPWMAALLILNVLVCDITAYLTRKTISIWAYIGKRIVLAVPISVGLSLLLSPWTEITYMHSAILGGAIPILAVMGQHTSAFVKRDLKISEDLLIPGRGKILDNIQSLLYAAPVMFHYIRYFIK